MYVLQMKRGSKWITQKTSEYLKVCEDYKSTLNQYYLQQKQFRILTTDEIEVEKGLKKLVVAYRQKPYQNEIKTYNITIKSPAYDNIIEQIADEILKGHLVEINKKIINRNINPFYNDKIQIYLTNSQYNELKITGKIYNEKTKEYYTSEPTISKLSIINQIIEFIARLDDSYAVIDDEKITIKNSLIASEKYFSKYFEEVAKNEIKAVKAPDAQSNYFLLQAYQENLPFKQVTKYKQFNYNGNKKQLIYNDIIYGNYEPTNRTFYKTPYDTWGTSKKNYQNDGKYIYTEHNLQTFRELQQFIDTLTYSQKKELLEVGYFNCPSCNNAIIIQNQCPHCLREFTDEQQQALLYGFTNIFNE